MKKSALYLFFNLIISLFFFLFIIPSPSFAAAIYYDTTPPTGGAYSVVSASYCGVAAQCANTYTTSTLNSACGLNGCGGGLNWTKYQLTCLEQSDEVTGEVIDYEGYYQQLGERVYSIGDKCISGETGLRTAFCDGSYGNTMYKRCCSNYTPVACIPASSTLQDGIYPDEGGCPAGTTETAPGVTSCPTPPPPSRCPSGVEAGQACRSCITQTCSNGTACGTGHEYCVYDPTNGNYCSSCITEVNTCSTSCTTTQPPSCFVSWNLSNSNPPTNSTVNVSVTGNSSNAGWSNVAYSLDGLAWNTNVSVPNPGTPNYTFNVNSDSAGPHSLRFAVNSGSVVCSSSGLNSFTTQAPVKNASCSQYTINSGNTVYVGQTVPVSISMTNTGDTTWTSSSLYRLGAEQPRDDPNWGTSTGADSRQGDRPTRRDLSYQVGPGGSFPFNFNAIAPTTAGTYRLSFQMLQEGVAWFGQMCQRNVIVSDLPPAVFVPSCTGIVTNTQTKTIRWDATVNPSGTYTYSWSGDASGTGASVTQTYATAGPKNATVSVRNSQNTLRTASCSATIPAPFSYNLTNTGNRSVTKGSSVSNTITANLISGATQSVAFSASGFPSGVTGSFSPTSCNPTCSSILTMNTTSTASTGTFPITVTGTSSGASNQTTRFNLTVNAPAAQPPRAFTQNAPAAACSGTSPYVDLSWNSSTNATSYEVYRNGSFITGGLNQLNYRDSAVSPSTSYTYVISAKNNIDSIDSNSRSVTSLSCSSGPVPSPTPPPTPTPTPSPSSGCAWIQTTGGDVHSNTGINTPCGP